MEDMYGASSAEKDDEATKAEEKDKINLNVQER